MQHYQLETRLFDVSYNPLVALYFAVASSPNEDGHLIIFELNKKELKYYDSDAVSCVANLANLTPGERNQLRKLTTPYALKTSAAGKRLLQFIRAEKPYFLPIIQPSDLSSIFLVKAKQNNKRIIAQQGAFFLFGLTSEIEPALDGIVVKRIAIPRVAKVSIKLQLDLLNINESSLFPEIEYAATYIMSKITPVVDVFS